MKNTLIVCCFPSCGRTYLSTTLANHLFSTPNGLQAYTFSNFEKCSVLGNTSTLVDNIVSKIGEVDFILTGMDEDILQELDRRNLQFVIVVPNASRQLTDFEKQIIKQQWFGRMVMRQNVSNPLFSTVLELMKSDYDRMTSDDYIHKYNPINVVRLYESQYLSTVIEKLYAYKEKLANGLTIGKGQCYVDTAPELHIKDKFGDRHILSLSLDSGVQVTGATLLTVDEAKQLPKSIFNIDHPWWLRSPDSFTDYAAYVYGYGCVRSIGGLVDCDVYDVRPALNINLESSNLNIGDRFTFGDKEFEIISNDKALCTDIIGECTFRENWKADDANDYEASDIKKFVDEWYENCLKKEQGYIDTSSEFDPASYIKNKLYDKYSLLPEAAVKGCTSPQECEELILSVRRFL